MDPACLRHTEIPGTSKLFADLSYHFDRVARFYRHNPHERESYATAAREVQYPDDRRAAVARVLEAQNPGNPLVGRFAQPGTVAVLTGQQVGLFSGPAYTIYKALTSARLAEVSTATTTQTIATATMAPIGTRRLSRALSQRDRLRSPAICDCAVGNTLRSSSYENGV